MYEYFLGKIKEISPLNIVLEVNNIGYLIFTPTNYCQKLKIEENIKIYIQQIIKEDSHVLYGFLSKKDKSLFEILIGVSGIGPKTALGLMGHLDFSNLRLAIAKGDIRLISKVPGIGKKIAERLIIEIRDKFKKVEFLEEDKEEGSQHILDALNALITLGYHHTKAQKAIEKVLQEHKEEKDVGTIISLALRNI